MSAEIDLVGGPGRVLSATTAPPELKSQNGVLEVTLNFLRPHPQRSSLNGARMARGRRRQLRLRIAAGLAAWPVAWRSDAGPGSIAIVFTAIGCGGAAKIDPGTPTGTYTAVVTAAAKGGSDQANVNVPIIVQ